MTRSAGIFLSLLLVLLAMAMPVASQEPAEQTETSTRAAAGERGSDLHRQLLERCRAADERSNRPCRMLLFCERLTNSNDANPRSERICARAGGFLRQIGNMPCRQASRDRQEGAGRQEADSAVESNCLRPLARLFNAHRSWCRATDANQPSRHVLRERSDQPGERAPTMERSNRPGRSVDAGMRPSNKAHGRGVFAHCNLNQHQSDK